MHVHIIQWIIKETIYLRYTTSTVKYLLIRQIVNRDEITGIGTTNNGIITSA